MNPVPPAGHQSQYRDLVCGHLQTENHLAWKAATPPMVHTARNVKKSWASERRLYTCSFHSHSSNGG